MIPGLPLSGKAVTVLAIFLLVVTGCAPPVERTSEPAPHALLPAPAPTLIPPEPPPTKARPQTIAARRQLARDLQDQGNLAGALLQWQVLRTLDPENREIRNRVEATRAEIRSRVAERLSAGTAAERLGDPTGARAAYLAALATAPRNREALEALRALEGEAVYAVQQARTEKLRARRARAAARKAAGKQPTAEPVNGEDGNGQERDYRDTGIALFEAGDYQASVLELKKYLGSFPEDGEALEVLNKAEAQLAKKAYGGEAPAPAPPARAAPPPSPTIAAAPPAQIAAEPLVTEEDREAAQELYEQGVRRYRQDIGAAIELWEQSLARDPAHVQARLRLEQAHKMQHRLEAIGRP